jgi:hypothetical protein
MKDHTRKFLVLAVTGALFVSALFGTNGFPVTHAGAQTLRPAYLSQMPAPARILGEIKGKNAEDTIERQMGAFMALNKMIDDMAYGLERRYLPTRITPDELKLKDTYSYAYADLWHKATNKEDHLYDHDRELLGELLTKFFPQSFRDLYDKSDTNSAAYYKAWREKMSGPLLTNWPAGSAPPQQSEVEKLCAAKGLNMLACMGQGMFTGFMKIAEGINGPPVPGLRISGAYKAGNFSMRLDQQGGNAWVNCGDVTLISDYDVVRKGDQIQVKVTNADDPITLTLRPDGTTLAGPLSAQIHGHTPPSGGGSASTSSAGSSQEVTTTQQRTLTPLEAQQYPGATQNGQTYTINETTTSTQYKSGSGPAPVPWPAKSAPCKLGVLSALPAVPAQAEKKSEGLAGLLDGMIPPSPFVPNGLRMAGTYEGQNGSHIEFLADKAILGCHVTLAEHPYTVTLKAGQLLINLDGAGTLKGFTLGTDGILHGDNSPLYIRGHKKTGVDAIGDGTYATSSDTCGYGTLSPKVEKQN